MMRASRSHYMLLALESGTLACGSRSVSALKIGCVMNYNATPNLSIEGTSTSQLRPFAAAPHVKR